MSPKKILLAGSEIAGHYTGLSKAFTMLGIPHTLAARPNKFVYDGDYSSNRIFSLINTIENKRDAAKFIVIRYFYSLIIRAIKLFIPLYVIKNFDCVMFAFGNTYTGQEWELWLYKRFNVKMVFTFHGSDARPPYINAAYFPMGSKVDWERMRFLTKKTYNSIKIIEKYSDVIFAYPAISHFFTKPFCFGPFGNPVSVPEHIKSNKKRNKIEEKVVVLHAPSHPASKGTNEISKIIKKLKQSGLNVEFVTITNVPNHEVLEAIFKADIILDSMWNDTPTGTFPAEGAHLGKPVIIGSYFSKTHPKYFEKNKMITPYVYCDPDEVSIKLDTLIRDASFYSSVVNESEAYVSAHGCLEAIGLKYLRCINGRVPKNWIIDPEDIIYLHGYGAPEEHIRYLVNGYLSRFGKESLCLSHRPDLEKAFIKFAMLE